MRTIKVGIVALLLTGSVFAQEASLLERGFGGIKNFVGSISGQEQAEHIDSSPHMRAVMERYKTDIATIKERCDAEKSQIPGAREMEKELPWLFVSAKDTVPPPELTILSRKLTSLEKKILLHRIETNARCQTDLNKAMAAFRPEQRTYLGNLMYLNSGSALRIVALDTDIKSILAARTDHQKFVEQVAAMEMEMVNKPAETQDAVSRQIAQLIDDKLTQTISELDDLYAKAVENGCTNTNVIGPFSICL